MEQKGRLEILCGVDGYVLDSQDYMETYSLEVQDELKILKEGMPILLPKATDPKGGVDAIEKDDSRWWRVASHRRRCRRGATGHRRRQPLEGPPLGGRSPPKTREMGMAPWPPVQRRHWQGRPDAASCKPNTSRGWLVQVSQAVAWAPIQVLGLGDPTLVGVSGQV
ncbi:hypothetical protein Scep_025733 [Stephania cephalantha]|uniref:Uncharacterized protein n=1 Tax=Stephania cephalantha TaxID=152367 RepID=A0AAP0EJ86_9MAGN